ncbi:MAG: inositol monophosphatase family protein [Dehalococcoidia bacterium]|jgi:myo-inositol-1(or 4)-monophosphatase
MPDRNPAALPQSVHQESAYAVARYAAVEAGKILKGRFGMHHDMQVKGKRNLVTEADLLSEKRIIAIILEEFPGHGILSEEAGSCKKGGEYTWIIDPLDGTNNYYFGIPFFGVNIALVRKGEVVLGLTYDPMRHEMFRAEKGKGAFLNRKKIHVSKLSSLDGAALGVDLGYNAERSLELLALVEKMWPHVHCLRLMGSSALGLAYVAAGRLSLYFHKYVYPWDIASGLLLVREGGGDVITFEGRATKTQDKEIIAANPSMLQSFRESLKKS